MSLPLVSIIIPVYNGANYMREAIDSALAQTYENIEILVINDGSKDDGATEEVALSYGDAIRYFRKENGGVSSALNYGIEHMNGEYFSWLSHDDVYTPDKVQKQMEQVLSREADDVVVICNMNTINQDSVEISSASENFYHEEMSWKEALIYVTKAGANGCALLIPKAAFDQVGRFDENLRYCQDILMWWEIFFAGYGLIFCDYVGVHSRVHGKQLTQTGSALYHHDASYIGDIVVKKFADASDQTYNCLYLYAKGEAIHGNRGVVKKCTEVAKNKHLFSTGNRVALLMLSTYGRVRPFIRRVYYKLFRNINTK